MDKLFFGDATKKTLTTLVKIRDITIDNHVFRLHYRFTSLILIVFSLLVTGTQFFGDPIRCIQRDDIPERVINTFCWIESTYSLPKAFNKTVGKQVPYPGVDKTEDGDDVVEHAYYQWVCFVLFLQAIVFYLPRVLWKTWEKRKIVKLVADLYQPIVKEKLQEKCNLLAKYFNQELHRHYWYATMFYVCEIINLANVIFQIFLVDIFLGGEFTTYGIKVIAYTQMDQDKRLDPMVRVFPRMTKCRFHRFGSSGDVQTHDAFCLLPINIVNEKIYIMLWFWFIILAILSGLAVIYRLVVMLSPQARDFVFKLTRVNKILDVDAVMDKCDYGDWFMLRLLSKNMHALNFKRFIATLSYESSTGEYPDPDTFDTPFPEKMPLIKYPKTSTTALDIEGKQDPGDDSTLMSTAKLKEK